MNGAQMAEVIVRHHITWGDSEAVCECGWRDIAPLFGYHLLGELLDLEDALSESIPHEVGLQPTIQRKHSDRVEGASDDISDPRTERMLERATLPDPVVPSEDDLRSFESIRSGEAASYSAVDRLLGFAPSRTFQRFDLLERYGTLPDDMVEWRKTRRNRRTGGNRPPLRAVDALGTLALHPGQWAPLCMSEQDFSDWRKFNRNTRPKDRLERPCEECPLAYALEMRAQDRCNGEPGKAA